MIIVSCSSSTYLLTSGYIESIIYQFKKRNILTFLHKYGETSLSITEYIINNEIKNSVIIFIQYLPNKLPDFFDNKSFFLNMDQMIELSFKKYSVFAKISSIKIPLIDYSPENVNNIVMQFPDKKIYYFPYMFNPNDTIFQTNDKTEEYDIGIIYSPTPHRSEFINKLLRGTNFKINLIRNKFGIERDVEICKCKILLNLHYSRESNILESIRCYPILFKKIIVISEESVYDSNIKLNNLIVYESFDNLMDKIKDVLENFSIYKEKLDSFDFDSQYQEFEKNIDSFIKNEYKAEFDICLSDSQNTLKKSTDCQEQEFREDFGSQEKELAQVFDSQEQNFKENLNSQEQDIKMLILSND